MIPLLPSAAPRRDPTGKLLLASFRHDRRWMMMAAAAVIAGTVGVAMSIPKSYRADSNLLVLLGSEYTYRSSAGENMNVSNALDREQILRTEIAILEVPDLHRQVIQDIGVARVYPELLRPPGLSARAREAAVDLLSSISISLGFGKIELAQEPAQHADPLDAAVLQMDKDLTLQAVKSGNAINISYTNADPQIAADVINRLEAAYIQKRRSLYTSHDAQLVNAQVDQLRGALDAAERRLADFKLTSGISDLAARRGVLITQQGQLEADLRTSNGLYEQDSARLAQLDRQLSTLSDAYRTPMNPVMVQLQWELARVRAEMLGVKAQAANTSKSLADVNAKLKTLDGSEQQMAELQRGRDVLADNYRAAVKVRDERQLSENVETNRASNVRVLQPAVVPTEAIPYRHMLGLAGLLVAPLVAFGVGLLMHFFRRGYLLPEAVEADTGLRVLMTVADRRRSVKGLLLQPGKAA